METISGKPNILKIMGTFNPETNTFTPEIPEEMVDFVFYVEGEICFVETNQQFEYDDETGCFYLIKEVD